MGWITKILIVVLLVIAFAFFFPKTYNSGKDWTVDKVSSVTNDNVGNVLNSVVDITDYSCDNDQDCINHYMINGLKCISNKCEAS